MQASCNRKKGKVSNEQESTLHPCRSEKSNLYGSWVQVSSSHVESREQNDPVQKSFRYQSSHPPEQIISDINKEIQTRRVVYETFSAFFSFLSSIELVSYKLTLNDQDWMLAMRDELNEFERNQVWHLEPRPLDRLAIGTSWVSRHKFDDLGTIV